MNEDNRICRKRIAVFTSEDMVWNLPTWKRAIPLLIEEHDVVGIYLFPERLTKLTGIGVLLWYLRVFGLWNTLLLSLFGVRRRLGSLFSSVRGWQQLADRYEIPLLRAPSPNAEEVVRWSEESDTDIIAITVGDILKERIIKTAKIGVVNKHAGVLPYCRGVFPFFWARLTGVPTGITFHHVDAGIDTGRGILQVEYPSHSSTISMLRFYADVLAMYPQMLRTAVNRMVRGKVVELPSAVESSYYSLPTRDDYLRFRGMGFKVARVSDLFYSPPPDVAEEPE